MHSAKVLIRQAGRRREDASSEATKVFFWNQAEEAVLRADLQTHNPRVVVVCHCPVCFINTITISTIPLSVLRGLCWTRLTSDRGDNE